MIVLDQDGHVAAGTSTNGLTHKVPGCVIMLILISKIGRNILVILTKPREVCSWPWGTFSNVVACIYRFGENY